MTGKEYVKAAAQVTKTIADYHENIRGQSTIVANREVGFLQKENLVPANPPQKGEPWQNVYADLDKVVLKNVRNFVLSSNYTD